MAFRSATRKYVGPVDELLCQGGTASRPCLLPVRTYGPVRIKGVLLMMYRCDKGHHFAVQRVPSAGDLAGAVVYIFEPPDKPSFGARL